MGDVPRTEHSALSATALERRDFPMLAGFALFQAWVTLCFFTPQLFPDAVGDNNVYMLSLAVSVAALALGAWKHHVAAALLQRSSIRWGLATCAAVGTALIPFCFGSSPMQLALTAAAALLTGLAIGFFNVAWCQAFVHRGNAVDFTLSIVTSSVAIYVLTNLAYTPAVSPLVMLALSVAMPVVSALLLNLNRSADHGGERIVVPIDARPRRSYLLRLCVGIFAISLADEFMRNYYLEGTDLSFYSSQINLLILVFKIVVSIMTVTAIRRMQYEEFSFLYRASFMLALIAALLLPFAEAAGPVGYALANCGAFVFKLTVFLVCLEYCARGASAALTFCIVRGVWSLDLLLGSGLLRHQRSSGRHGHRPWHPHHRAGGGGGGRLPVRVLERRQRLARPTLPRGPSRALDNGGGGEPLGGRQPPTRCRPPARHRRRLHGPCSQREPLPPRGRRLTPACPRPHHGPYPR